VLGIPSDAAVGADCELGPGSPTALSQRDRTLAPLSAPLGPIVAGARSRAGPTSLAVSPRASTRENRVDPAQQFQTASQLHRQGRLAEAEQLYGQILKIAPAHFGALYHLATLCARAGRLSEALPLFRRAVDADARSVHAHLNLGGILAALNRPAEAIVWYQRALGIEPDHLETRLSFGNALQALHRPLEAIVQYRHALALKPEYADAHYNLGNVLRDCQQPSQAVAHYQQAIAARPNFAEAHNNLGNALMALNRPHDAIAHYQKALALQGDDARVHTNLGNAWALANRLEPAIAHYEQALKAAGAHASPAAGNPADALECLGALACQPQASAATLPAAFRTRCHLGVLLAALHRPDEAIAHFEQALRLVPDNADALRHLGDVLQAIRHHEEAIDRYRQALAIRPNDAALCGRLASALQASGRPTEAIALGERALALDPHAAEARGALGRALMALNRNEEAIAHFQASLALAPDHAETHNNLGVALQLLGRAEEAATAYQTAIRLAPTSVMTHFNLASVKAFSVGDPRLEALEALAKEADTLGEDDRIALEFALAKAFADLEERSQSFHHLREGNALKRRQIVYDEPAIMKFFERITATFTPALMREKGSREPSALPVFVVGMPRSGTTLVEQILASHSEVFGAGEREDLNQAVLTHFGPREAAASFPECLSTVTPATLRQFAAHYLEGIKESAPRAQRVVDKMPLNFLFVGLIHLALPNARIIHACRDPVDTCFSCFSLLFAGHQPFVYDLGELGRYYRAYETLMAHWRAVLPRGVMIDVNYEDVVADLETQARRMVAHCDLEWQPRCLDFYKTPRGVRTASSTQVRQPIYRHALGRSRRYQEFLEPLLQALGVGRSQP
jgi:tetratricopeptide (TPR) repeat protein